MSDELSPTVAESGSSGLHEVAVTVEITHESPSARSEIRYDWWFMLLATLVLLMAMWNLERLLAMLLGGTPGLLWPHMHQSLPELLIRRMLETSTLLWFFMLGGSFGSFLHCVVYRVPRGISVAASGSSCPGCGSKIKAWHNIPLFGWLVLRGCCAACGWKIPVRYALAELLFGSMFLLLVIPELIMSGYNLPGLRGPYLVNIAETVWFPRWLLIQYYLLHVTLGTFCMTACLFALDRVPLPRSIMALGFLLLTVFLLCWPHVLPLSISNDVLPARDRAELVFRAAMGLGVGVMLGVILVRRRWNNVQTGDASATIACLAAVGLAGGWQFALGVAFLSFVPRMSVLVLPGNRGWTRLPLSIWITLAAVLHLLCWRWLLQLPSWPGHAPGSLAITFAPLLCMGLSFVVEIWEAKSRLGE